MPLKGHKSNSGFFICLIHEPFTSSSLKVKVISYSASFGSLFLELCPIMYEKGMCLDIHVNIITIKQHLNMLKTIVS